MLPFPFYEPFIIFLAGVIFHLHLPLQQKNQLPGTLHGSLCVYIGSGDAGGGTVAKYVCMYVCMSVWYVCIYVYMYGSGFRTIWLQRFEVIIGAPIWIGIALSLLAM